MAGNHALRRLKGAPTARKFCTIDIETRQWTEPYAVGFFDGENYTETVNYKFDGSVIHEALAGVFVPRYSGHWIYAHNGGNFDFLFLLHYLTSSPEARKRFTFDATPVGSCIVRLDVREKHAAGGGEPMRWTFVDSARLMPIPLKDVGKTFGIGHKVELQMSYDDLALPQNRATMEHYLRVDCILLWKAVNKFQTLINDIGGQIGITLPATSLDTFRRRFQREDIVVNRHFRACPDYAPPDEYDDEGNLVIDNEGDEAMASKATECRGCMHEFIRRGYFGGRTEIFRMGFRATKAEPTARMYDINSSYPHTMLEPMPVGPAIEAEGMSEADVYRNARKMVGIVECDVEIPETCYLPPLPLKRDGKLIFPVGRFSGVWDAAELTLLPRVGGAIVRTRRSLWFHSEPVFDRFVRYMYRYRDKSDPLWNPGLDFVAKILLNSAYGKFAMREERERIVMSPESPTGMKAISEEGDIWSEDVRVVPQYIVPQLSVHVTALARRNLWEFMSDALSQGGKVYYTDTDSIVVSGCTLKTGTKLGELKAEAEITRATFTLPKLYLIETVEESSKKKRERNIKVKAKGMGPGIKMGGGGACDEDAFAGQLSEAEYQDIVEKGAPLTRQRLTKFKEAIRAFAKEKLGFPRVIAATKQIQSTYDKRIVMDDGDTRPIVLGIS